MMSYPGSLAPRVMTFSLDGCNIPSGLLVAEQARLRHGIGTILRLSTEPQYNPANYGVPIKTPRIEDMANGHCRISICFIKYQSVKGLFQAPREVNSTLCCHQAASRLSGVAVCTRQRGYLWNGSSLSRQTRQLTALISHAACLGKRRKH